MTSDCFSQYAIPAHRYAEPLFTEEQDMKPILTLIALIPLAGCAGPNSYAQEKPDFCLKEDPRFNAASCIDHYKVELTRRNSSSD
jgi:hypothetical protein